MTEVFDAERVRREEVLAPEEMGMVLRMEDRRIGRGWVVFDGNDIVGKLGLGGGLKENCSRW